MPPGEDQLAPVRQPPEEQRPLLRLKAQQADEILAAAGAVLQQVGPDGSQVLDTPSRSMTASRVSQPCSSA